MAPLVCACFFPRSYGTIGAPEGKALKNFGRHPVCTRRRQIPPHRRTQGREEKAGENAYFAQGARNLRPPGTHRGP